MVYYFYFLFLATRKRSRLPTHHSTINSLGSVTTPVTAAAAATNGLASIVLGTGSLSSFKVPVARTHCIFTGRYFIIIHRETCRTTGLAQLKTRFQ